MSKNNKNEEASKTREDNNQWKSNNKVVMKVQLEDGKSTNNSQSK